VEVAVAAGDLDAAARAADELAETATTFGALKQHATASTARARVQVAAGDWVGACSTATHALQRWQQLGAPYETATARVLHARACRALDDHDGWTTSLDVAAELFASLGAAPDLAAVDRLRVPHPGVARLHRLTPREVVVLRLLATGATNKVIAAELVVSEKTVSRHLGNIFTKLSVSTRAAATAYAFTHDLVRER
jgi:DNA-binding CsgD family transcriptional regulator